MISGKKVQDSWFQNEAKQNWYDVCDASPIIELLDDFMKMEGF